MTLIKNPVDIEKKTAVNLTLLDSLPDNIFLVTKRKASSKGIFRILWNGFKGVKTKEILPVLEEEEIDTSFWNTFFMWFSTNIGISGLSARGLASYC